MKRFTARLEETGGWTFWQAALSAALLWAALPPLDIWPLAWIAPLPWLRLIRQQELPLPRAGGPSHGRPWRLLAAALAFFLVWIAVNGLFLGYQYRMYWAAELVFWPLGLLLLAAAARSARRRPYLLLWLVGFSFWLAALQFLRLPHWATGFGWLALSFYFAFYLPVFIAASRAAVHRLRVPLIVAAPVVWTGLELLRAHLFSGMSMACLAHTQYRLPALIQVSDLGGAFAVSFLVMFVAACLARALPCDKARWAAWPLLPAAALMAAALAYGHLRTSVPAKTDEPATGVALIQGAIDSQMQYDEDKLLATYWQYCELSAQALAEAAKKGIRLDLIVWPESMFPEPWTTYAADATAQAAGQDMPEDQFRRELAEAARHSRTAMANTAGAMGTAMIFGVDRRHFTARGGECYNTAVYVSAKGEVLGSYDKINLVMFGEYVPLAEYLPWLQRLTPLPESASAGREPKTFVVADRGASLRLAPNICYESVLSHAIRRQVRVLAERGEEPDVLVNLSNDGWFWGSSELEMHLACGVFRAVECRKPFLIAANTGISAWIDGDGRILDEGPRRQRYTLLAQVRRDFRHSFYLDYGDWPAGLCLAATCVFALAGLWGLRRARKGVKGEKA
jgi:apolipoprotein N-acyltransferase